MIVLVTGAFGFTGRHMISFLLSVLHENDTLYGTTHTNKTRESIAGCKYLSCDLTVYQETENLINSVSPDIIINLAGTTHGSLNELFQGNVIITKNILEALVNLRKTPRVLLVGSSAEYGYAGEDPISEKTPVNPISEYGIVKVASTFLALNYFQKDVPIVIGRPFNLIGPGQSKQFVCGNIVHQVSESRESEISIIVKNLDSRRDFLDVRDAVMAYWQILIHDSFSRNCAGKIFNIGSGSSYNTQEIINIISALIPQKLKIISYSNSIPDRIPIQIADTRLLSTVILWNPTIPIRKSLDDMVKYEQIMEGKKNGSK